FTPRLRTANSRSISTNLPMGGSITPGPTCHDAFTASTPPRTCGPWGYSDAGEVNLCSVPGDTPGAVGVQDRAAAKATPPKTGTVLHPFPPTRLKGFRTAPESDFMRRVYQGQLNHNTQEHKPFFPGVNEGALSVVETEGKRVFKMRSDAAE